MRPDCSNKETEYKQSRRDYLMLKPKDMNIKPSMCDLIVAIKNRIQKQSCRDFLMVKPKDMNNIKPSMGDLIVAIKKQNTSNPVGITLW